jgi:DNA-binding NarL/FixJ family response regulator
MMQASRTTPITIALADDHQLVREALSSILAQQGDLRVVAEVGSGVAAVDCVRTLRPDIVVLDIGLPDVNGIEVAARIRRLHGATRIVALSAYADKRFVKDMLRAGASAYVSKASAGTELIKAIRAVASAESHFSPDVAGALVADLHAAQPDGQAQLGRREREVLRLIADGNRSLTIAHRLHIAVSTVEVHRRNIMRKLNMHTVAELTRYAVREGIVQP